MALSCPVSVSQDAVSHSRKFSQVVYRYQAKLVACEKLAWRPCNSIPSRKLWSCVQRRPGRDGHRGLPIVRMSVNNAVGEAEVGLQLLLDELRKTMRSFGGEAQDMGDGDLLRFLRSQSMNVEKAAEKVVAHQKWKATLKPKGSISEAEIPDQLAMGKCFLQGHTKRGYPVLVTLGRKHEASSDSEQLTRFVVYTIDKVIASAPAANPYFVGIVDLKGLGLKNLDAQAFIASFTILQDHYPGLLDKLFMVNAPFIFTGLWKVVLPFLDQETREKVIFVDKKKMKETLLSEIDEDQLSSEYGGTVRISW